MEKEAIPVFLMQHIIYVRAASQRVSSRCAAASFFRRNRPNGVKVKHSSFPKSELPSSSSSFLLRPLRQQTNRREGGRENSRPTTMEGTLLHHIGIVLSVLAFLSYVGRCCGPFAYFFAFLYLCLVHQRYTVRQWRKLRFQANKQANQKRLLSDTESVNWLNHAIAKVWPICMENVASQQFLLPVIPWFLDKYKPWTAKKAIVQHLYLGKNPPLITQVRVIPRSAGDDHLVLELGLNFLSGNDMSAVLAVKLRKRLGFGLWTKMHVTGMHVEGKVLVGVKFLSKWPFLSRIRVSFIGPPYFQMTAKPIFQHGLDVTEIPGIAGWLDKILSAAFEQSLVEPNMLVVDVEKFVSVPAESWFKVDEKPPIAHARVEIIEGTDMKPADLNGLSDPYVKGQLGPYRFRTKIQKKTLNPKWLEEFMIPINSWEVSNTLILEVRDKDHIFDDQLGDCTVNISQLKSGQRNEIWIPLQNIKTGRLHLALTIIEGGENMERPKEGHDQLKINEDSPDDKQTEDGFRRPKTSSSSSSSSEHATRSSDEFEPIPVPGSDKTGVWVHRPGGIVPQKWESRKGRSRKANTEIQCEDVDSPTLSASRLQYSNSATNSGEEIKDEKKILREGKLRRGLRTIGSMFNKNLKNDEGDMDERVDIVLTPRPNLRAAGDKRVNLKLVVDDIKVGDLNELQNNDPFCEKAEPDNLGKSQIRDAGKGIVKHAGKILRKSFKKEKEREEGNGPGTDSSSTEESPPSPMPSSHSVVEGVSMPSNCKEPNIQGVEFVDAANNKGPLHTADRIGVHAHSGAEGSSSSPGKVGL